MTWTKTPPTEPGFYWVRNEAEGELHVCQCIHVDGGPFWLLYGIEGGGSASHIAECGYEFWSERIEPPNREDA